MNNFATHGHERKTALTLTVVTGSLYIKKDAKSMLLDSCCCSCQRVASRTQSPTVGECKYMDNVAIAGYRLICSKITLTVIAETAAAGSPLPWRLLRAVRRAISIL